MSNSTFQYLLLGVLIVIIVVAVAVFAGVGGGAGGVRGTDVTITIWGPYAREDIDPYVQPFNQNNSATVGTIRYEQKNSATFETDLVNALASGEGPDVVFMPHSLLVRQADKLQPLLFSQFSQRQFLDTYADGADIFLTNEGILALPVSVDPTVMYWNKSLLASAGITTAPQYWDEVLALPKKLSAHDTRGTILQSAIALGGYRNITHAKDILSTLFLQAGDLITEPVYQEKGISANATLGSRANSPLDATESALRFFMQFGDPAKDTYSWNTALPQSREMFVAGKLAIYIGKASDLKGIVEANPHLSFDVAPVPTIRPANPTQKVTTVYGDFTGLGVLRASKNVVNAMQAAYLLSSKEYAQLFAQSANLPSVRRDLLSYDEGKDARRTTFLKAAISARGWLDPDPVGSDKAFRTMIEALASGALTEGSALASARADLLSLIR